MRAGKERRRSAAPKEAGKRARPVRVASGTGEKVGRNPPKAAKRIGSSAKKESATGAGKSAVRVKTTASKSVGGESPLQGRSTTRSSGMKVAATRVVAKGRATTGTAASAPRMVSGPVPPAFSMDSSPSPGEPSLGIAVAGGLRKQVERSATLSAESPIKAGGHAESSVGNGVSASANARTPAASSDGERAMFPLPIPIASFTI